MSGISIVFVHGNFVSKKCWEPWITRYEAQGHRCLAIAYPGRDEPVEALRRKHPDPTLGRLSIAEVLEHHVRIIRALPEKPVLIGHSFGGLLTQILLQRDLGAAGVAIDSVPPQGVPPTQWSSIRSLWPGLNPFISTRKPWLMSFEQFRYAFVHTLPEAEQRAVYEELVVPESRLLMRGGLSGVARVDFAKPRPPLLMIAGEHDHIMPAALNQANYRRYRASPSVTDFKLFPGRVHHIIGEGGWEEVADYALDWALQVPSTGKSGPRQNGAADVGVPQAAVR